VVLADESLFESYSVCIRNRRTRIKMAMMDRTSNAI
jgi:hypothetical protein